MQFDFPAEVQHVLHVREAAYKVCLEMGFTAHDAGLIITAIWEAALNAATHGSPRGNEDWVRAIISAEDDTLRVHITSQNRRFHLPSPRPTMDPATIRGRGLPIIYAFMDDVSLTDDEYGVTLHMAKHMNGFSS